MKRPPFFSLQRLLLDFCSNFLRAVRGFCWAEAFFLADGGRFVVIDVLSFLPMAVSVDFVLVSGWPYFVVCLLYVPRRMFNGCALHMATSCPLELHVYVFILLVSALRDARPYTGYFFS